MSEAPKRNSTRERKPNRFLTIDEPDPPHHHSAARQPEPRDQRQLPEQTQLARILLRFLTNANKKLRQAPPREDRDEVSQQAIAAQSHRLSNPATKINEKRSNGSEAQGRSRNDPRRPAQEETPRSNSKAGDRKQHPSVRAANSASTETQNLKKTSAETQGSAAGGKEGQRKKKPGQQRGQRQELRPFKRQSYHVAIAYHVYLKRAREGLPASVDPTYHARRLREMQEKMQLQERKRA